MSKDIYSNKENSLLKENIIKKDNNMKKQSTAEKKNTIKKEDTVVSGKTNVGAATKFWELVELEKETLIKACFKWIEDGSKTHDYVRGHIYSDSRAKVYAITLKHDLRGVYGARRAKQARESAAMFRRAITELLGVSLRPQARIDQPKLNLYPDARDSRSGRLVEPSRYLEDPHHHGIILIPGNSVKAFEELIKRDKWDTDKPRVPSQLDFLSSIKVTKLESADDLSKWLDYSMKFQVPASRSGYYDVEPYIYPDPHFKSEKRTAGPRTAEKSRNKARRRPGKVGGNSPKMACSRNSFI